jgi:hypothetical protein
MEPIMRLRLFFTPAIRWVWFLALFIGISETPVCAALIDQIAEDFRPISGYVVRVLEEEVIIDLDQSHGVSMGDLFNVLASGEKIVHPITGKVIGTLEESRAILQVTRTKKGYSFVRPLRKPADIKAGDPISRFEHVPARLWDYTGKGRDFADQLQIALPGLDWQDYEIAQQSRPDELSPPLDKTDTLVFILTDQSLEVRGPNFRVLHFYDLPESFSADGKTPPGVKGVPESTSVVPEDKQAMSFKAVFKAARTIGSFPGTILMSDFVRFNNQLLLATTDGSEIHIYEVTDNLKHILKKDTPFPAQILSLQWWQPTKTGPLFLTVVTWRDKNVSGILYTLKNGQLALRKTGITRILGNFDLDNDGRPETLLGQRFESEDFFGTNIVKFSLKGNKLKSTRSPVSLPRRFTVLGSLITDLNGDGKLESVFIRSGILYVYHGKKQLYASQKEMGGTISVLTYEKDLLTKDIMTQTAAFEISPVVTDIDGDGRVELLAVSSDKKFFTAPGILPNVKNTRLTVLKFKDGRFIKGTIGEKIERPIQGLTVSNDRVLFVITEPGSIFGKDGSSHLLEYPLAKR